MYYSNQDVLEALAYQCAGREVFLKGLDRVSPRPLKAEGKEELVGLFENYWFKDRFGVFSSVERYSNPLDLSSKTGWDFVIDLDGGSLDQLKICVLSLVGVLEIFDLNSVKVKFSGRRGFHLSVSGEAFDVFSSRIEFLNAYPRLPKAICEFLEAALKPEQKRGVKFDYEIYQPRRLLRLAYSLHEESGLVSLPLQAEEIRSFKLEDAAPERVKVDWGWLTAKPRVGEAWNLLDSVSEWLKKRGEETPALKIIKPPTSSRSFKGYAWIEALLSKPVDDGRHRILWLIVAPYLVNVKGLSVEEAERAALQYLERCDKVRRIEDNVRRLARYYVKYAKDHRLKPLSLSKLRSKYPDLYEKVRPQSA
jgi:DNA primase catalytic subunit